MKNRLFLLMFLTFVSSPAVADGLKFSDDHSLYCTQRHVGGMIIEECNSHILALATSTSEFYQCDGHFEVRRQIATNSVISENVTGDCTSQGRPFKDAGAFEFRGVRNPLFGRDNVSPRSVAWIADSKQRRGAVCFKVGRTANPSSCANLTFK